MDQPTFCVVCGRFDRELVIRKSGLKCTECCGKKHNKGFAQLQHQQATFVLSQTMHPGARGGGGNGSGATQFQFGERNAMAMTQAPAAGGGGGGYNNRARRTSFDLSATTSGRQPRSPRGQAGGVNAGNLSPRGQTRHSFTQGGGGKEQPSPNDNSFGSPSSPGSGGGPKPEILIPISDIQFDSLQVAVVDVRKDEFIKKGVIDSKEEVTTYGLRTTQAESGTEIITIRHRFRQVHSVMCSLKTVGQHALPAIPEKKVFSRFDAQFVENRRKEMEFFLNAALQNPFLARHPQLLGLLGLDVALREQERLRRAANATGTTGSPKLGNTGHVAGGGGKSPGSAALDQTLTIANTSISGPGSIQAAGSHLVPQGDLDDCRLGNVIGQGSFGTVKLGLLPTSSKLVAVKCMTVSSVHQNQIDVLQAELDLLRTLSHRNIVQFLGISWKPDEKQLAFFTEYVECGSIATLVKKFGSLPAAVIQRYMRQILTGIAYLHELDVVHRDIKGDNILVTKDGSVKVADFGCSTQLKELDIGDGKEGNPDDDGASTGAGAADGVTGTPLWMAPEAMRGDSQGLPADIWSIGCVGIEMLGNQPWKIGEHENVFTAMFRIQKTDGLPDGLPSLESGKVDPILHAFLVKCLKKEPSERPTAKELLADEFFLVDLGADSAEETGGMGVGGNGKRVLLDAEDAEYDFA